VSTSISGACKQEERVDEAADGQGDALTVGQRFLRTLIDLAFLLIGMLGKWHLIV
jgi:hypothetical protein